MWTPFAGQRVQERRHGGDQRLAFAGLELGDAAVVDGDAADELDVELALADRSLGGLADQGERLDQQAIERIALPGPQPQLVGRDFSSLGAKTSSSGSSALIRSTRTA